MFENLNTEELLSTLELALPYATNVLVALFILFLGWMISKSVHRNISKFAARKLDPMVAGFLAQLARYSVLAATVIAALERCGVETTSVVAIFASAGLAVGLALQGSLSNFAAGVMILIFRPFEVGHVVEAGGQAGEVTDIGLFATTLVTPDARTIIVPNSAIMGGSIVNHFAKPQRCVAVDVGVAYGTDASVVRDICLQVAKDNERVLDEPGTDFIFVEMAASSINFKLRVWVQPGDMLPVEPEIREAVYNALNANGIEIPFDQVVMHNA
jgi:small conductance mechanosensitive channel